MAIVILVFTVVVVMFALHERSVMGTLRRERLKTQEQSEALSVWRNRCADLARRNDDLTSKLARAQFRAGCSF